MSKKGAKGGKQNEFLQPTKEVLRGVILADSFDQKFVPITRQAPRALLPLVNVPLLDYTIEFLASAGVEEIFVFCCAHAKMIQDYLSESKWNHTPGLTIRPVVSYTSLSAGDALREMYNLDLIDSDFILVSGDLVANMRLDKVLAAHKARRQKDKNCIMTMVLKKAEPNHRTRSLQDDVVVALDKPTGKLLYFDNDPTSNSVDIDLEVYKSHSEVQIRYDLLDCRIDICSPEVLYLFADNFDYQELRQDFVRGIITSEILGNKMYTHVISGEYAARVKDLRTYDAVSKDIIHRWAYPLVPDNNFMGNTSFKYLRNSIYLENNVKLSRSCTVHEECAIGEGTEIGDKTNIYHSVIGRNCKIGNNVVIKGCYIWNDVTIGDNVVVKKSIICNGAKILSDSVVQKGCLISFDVVVGPNFTVPSLTKLTTYIPTTTTPKIGHKTEGSDFEDQDIDSDNEFTEDDRDALQDIDLGEQGFGRLWQEKPDYDPITNSLIGYELLKKSLQVSPGSGVRGSPLPKALIPQKADSKGSGVSFDDEISKFEKEARDMVHSSVIANHHLDNVVLEINGLKYAYNTTFSDCAVIILQTLLDEAKDEKPDVLMKSIQKILQRWSGLLLKFVTSSDDQVEVIWALQAFCEKPEKKQFKTVFPLILHKLYELEIIEEDAVWSWEKASKGSEENFVQLSEKFLKWLKEAEEEEDEDEDEDEEDEEEEEE